jgi:dienelactone hydrolase
MIFLWLFLAQMPHQPSWTQGGARVETVFFPNSAGRNTAAYLVTPVKRVRSSPAVLFVHWYESKSPTSNRSQYLPEATALANDGVTSLLIDTMWTAPDWYRTRDAAKDGEASEEQVRDLGKALDYLIARPHVDAKRVVYVGHDFGAQYGVVLAAREKRVKAWALQAFTTPLSDWFLFAPQRTPEQRAALIESMKPFDPLPLMKHVSPVLLQFGTKDFYVANDKARALCEAAPGPKQCLTYETGHALNNQSIKDRLDWVSVQLGLSRTPPIELRPEPAAH